MNYTIFKSKMDKLAKKEADILRHRKILEEAFMDAHGVPKVGDIAKDEHGIIKVRVTDRELNLPRMNWQEAVFSVYLGGNPVRGRIVDTSTKTGIIHTIKTF